VSSYTITLIKYIINNNTSSERSIGISLGAQVEENDDIREDVKQLKKLVQQLLESRR
jgi:hypothetical protein